MIRATDGPGAGRMGLQRDDERQADDRAVHDPPDVRGVEMAGQGEPQTPHRLGIIASRPAPEASRGPRAGCTSRSSAAPGARRASSSRRPGPRRGRARGQRVPERLGHEVVDLERVEHRHVPEIDAQRDRAEHPQRRRPSTRDGRSATAAMIAAKPTDAGRSRTMAPAAPVPPPLCQIALTRTSVPPATMSPRAWMGRIVRPCTRMAAAIPHVNAPRYVGSVQVTSGPSRPTSSSRPTRRSHR